MSAVELLHIFAPSSQWSQIMSRIPGRCWQTWCCAIFGGEEGGDKLACEGLRCRWEIFESGTCDKLIQWWVRRDATFCHLMFCMLITCHDLSCWFHIGFILVSCWFHVEFMLISCWFVPRTMISVQYSTVRPFKVRLPQHGLLWVNKMMPHDVTILDHQNGK